MRWRQAQPCRRRKAADWRAFPSKKKSFAGFVTKKHQYE